MIMKLSKILRMLVLIAILLGLGGQSQPVRAAETIYWVNSTADTVDADLYDPACADSEGRCTLRAAIQQAAFGWLVDPNSRVIKFSISPDALPIERVISIGSPLPTIDYPVTIQGPNQGTLGNNAPIVLDGGGGDYDGIWVITSGEKGQVTIRGLTIRNFGKHGIYVQGTVGMTIAGNRIGKFGGIAAVGNKSGIVIGHNANSMVIGGVNAADRNVISGNNEYGIYFHSGMTNVIWGNYIGVTADGASALGNGYAGIYFNTGASGNTIGGNTSARRNVISGNGKGIQIYGTYDNVIMGNYIGVNASGTAAIPNEDYGIFMDLALDTIIGGPNAGEGNLISGNTLAGIRLGNTGKTNNTLIRGNIIGANASMTAAIPNGSGVNIAKGERNIIGGTVAGAGNVIGGNSGSGIWLSSTEVLTTTVQGNWIGVSPGGAALPNEGNGVQINSAPRSTVGGEAAGAANTVAHNSLHGVRITGVSALHNLIVANSIFNNGLLGIKLGSDNAVTPNDEKDLDVGPNDFQNYPVINSVTYSSGNMLTIQGTLHSSVTQIYTIHLYGSDTCDPSGHGEGKVYLGKASSVMTNSSGNATFGFGPVGSATRYLFITATATDLYKNTSEFSYCKAPYALFLPVLVR